MSEKRADIRCIMAYGVMVALQILVLPVQVRILVSQLKRVSQIYFDAPS